MMFIYKILIVIIAALSYGLTVRILCVFPVPFDSHLSVFEILVSELTKKGHDVTALAPFAKKKSLENATVIDVRELSYNMWEERFNVRVREARPEGFKIDPMVLMRSGYITMNEIVNAQYSVPEMKQLLDNDFDKFDIILAEGCIRSSMIACAKINAPVILVSSLFGSGDNFYTVGGIVNPVYFPDFNTKKVWKLTFSEKIYAVYNYVRIRLLEWEMDRVENELIKKHFGSDETMSDLKKKVEMLFLNIHSIWDNNRPVPPAVLYMGALHLKDPKPITEEYMNYLDSSEHGVVYMSLGSKIRSSDLPPETLQIIMNVFRSLPYNVLWKWNGGDLPNKPDNVRLASWLPQNDLLHHPKMKAFITQCGLQSTDESIAANVPLIGLPVFADQWVNAQKYIQFGIGVELDIDNLSETEFRDTIIEVAESKSYRSNIRRLSEIMREQRKGTLEKALYLIEYVAEHKNVSMKSPLADLDYTEYFMLEVIIPLVLGALILISLCAYIIFSINKYFISSNKVNKRKMQ